MSFGFSVGDFVLLLQLARGAYRSCRTAGSEYNDLARAVRNLHSVLRTLHTEAQRPDSNVFKQDSTSTAKLLISIKECNLVLKQPAAILAKYGALSNGSDAGTKKKIWQRVQFGSKTNELKAIREKLISCTSSMAVLLDAIQLKAADRIESKVDHGFKNMTEEFEKMREVILKTAFQARATDRNGSTLSLRSLSTIEGDDKAVWRTFREELVKKGFKSETLDRYKDVLQAYMLKLSESDLLVNANMENPDPLSWWTKRDFADTSDCLANAALVDEYSSDESQSNEDLSGSSSESLLRGTSEVELEAQVETASPISLEQTISDQDLSGAGIRTLYSSPITQCEIHAEIARLEAAVEQSEKGDGAEPGLDEHLEQLCRKQNFKRKEKQEQSRHIKVEIEKSLLKAGCYVPVSSAGLEVGVLGSSGATSPDTTVAVPEPDSLKSIGDRPRSLLYRPSSKISEYNTTAARSTPTIPDTDWRSGQIDSRVESKAVDPDSASELLEVTTAELVPLRDDRLSCPSMSNFDTVVDPPSTHIAYEQIERRPGVSSESFRSQVQFSDLIIPPSPGPKLPPRPSARPGILRTPTSAFPEYPTPAPKNPAMLTVARRSKTDSPTSTAQVTKSRRSRSVDDSSRQPTTRDAGIKTELVSAFGLALAVAIALG